MSSHLWFARNAERNLEVSTYWRWNHSSDGIAFNVGLLELDVRVINVACGLKARVEFEMSRVYYYCTQETYSYVN